MNLRMALKFLTPGWVGPDGSGIGQLSTGSPADKHGGRYEKLAHVMSDLAWRDKLLAEEVAALAGRLGDHGRKVEHMAAIVTEVARGEEGGGIAAAKGGIVIAPGQRGEGALAIGGRAESKGLHAAKVGVDEKKEEKEESGQTGGGAGEVGLESTPNEEEGTDTKEEENGPVSEETSLTQGSEGQGQIECGEGGDESSSPPSAWEERLRLKRKARNFRKRERRRAKNLLERQLPKERDLREGEGKGGSVVRALPTVAPKGGAEENEGIGEARRGASASWSWGGVVAAAVFGGGARRSLLTRPFLKMLPLLAYFLIYDDSGIVPSLRSFYPLAVHARSQKAPRHPAPSLQEQAAKISSSLARIGLHMGDRIVDLDTANPPSSDKQGRASELSDDRNMPNNLRSGLTPSDPHQSESIAIPKTAITLPSSNLRAAALALIERAGSAKVGEPGLVFEHCPEPFDTSDNASYEVGTKVTFNGEVYECVNSPHEWYVMGTCRDNLFGYRRQPSVPLPLVDLMSLSRAATPLPVRQGESKAVASSTEGAPTPVDGSDRPSMTSPAKDGTSSPTDSFPTDAPIPLRERCEFCPIGMRDPELQIDLFPGMTCQTLIDITTTFSRDDPLCSDSEGQRYKLLCCSAPPSSSPLPTTSSFPSVHPTSSFLPTTSVAPSPAPTTYCEAFVEPGCDDGTALKCNEFANGCCEEDEECECKYGTKACRLALEQGLPRDALLYCGDYRSGAQAMCCSEYDVGGCGCDFWEQLCNEFPDRLLDSLSWRDHYSLCYRALYECCGEQAYYCECDFYTHATSSFATDSIYFEQRCGWANGIVPDTALDLRMLETIYNKTEGDYWSNKAGWMTDQDHCKWHGISCNEHDHVIKIMLKSNNLTGEFPSNSLSKLFALEVLDLADNNLWGTMAGSSYGFAYRAATSRWYAHGWESDILITKRDASIFFNLRHLSSVDLSRNNLSGEVDVLFAPALEYVNFSQNNFTSINRFKRFKRSHKMLKTCDLSHNSIENEAGDLMKNMPPNLEELILSNNLIHGPLPSSLENLNSLRRLHMDSNLLSGKIPHFSTSVPNLLELNLSNQSLTGNIPESLANLPFLSVLNLSRNHLSNTIPPVLSGVVQLKVLDLSGNNLTGSIPPELRKLEGILNNLDLSNNMLTGTIPIGLELLEDSEMKLAGNRFTPEVLAPLSLCFVSGFDLKNDLEFCPKERNALKEFHQSTKGSEWTNSSNWTDPYASHCDWKGIKCDEASRAIELNLTSNGLSGKLSPSIANLTFLNLMDLSDNDIKGKIPTEIGLLANLTHFKINHNDIIGNVPTELEKLQHLRLFQVHSNRFFGTIPLGLSISQHSDNISHHSSFISDCGVPSDFVEPLKCVKCTMCCNSQGNCAPKKKDATEYTWVLFILGVIGLCCMLGLSCLLYHKFKAHASMQTSTVRRPTAINPDTFRALDTIGRDSVYQFLLGKSRKGWVIALTTMAVQIWMLSVFVRRANRNVTDDRSDMVFTWKCPRDRVDCENEADLTPEGWVALMIIVMINLLRDVVNGGKMIVLATRDGFSVRTKIRFFFAGFFLTLVTLFTLYVSVMYNVAIANTSSELVINAVIILFITDTDERLFAIMMAINEDWIKRTTNLGGGQGGSSENESSELRRELVRVLEELQELREKLQTLSNKQKAMEGHSNTPQDVENGHIDLGGGRSHRSSPGDVSGDSSVNTNRSGIGRRRGQNKGHGRSSF